MTHPAQAIRAYCLHRGYPWESAPGHLNIVYIEGLNLDFSPNPDRFDEWNDLRIIVDHDPVTLAPYLRFAQVATTEPGRASTVSESARKLGGVARIGFRHYAGKWVQGYHNYSRTRDRHPALVQKKGEPVMVHRDFNRDGVRTGDPVSPAYGINHHGVLPGAGTPKKVGKHSAGYLVGLDWEQHLEFISITKTDPRYLKNPKFAYSATFIAGDDFLKFRTNVA